MTERHARRLVIFARNPLPGRVKTRLIPDLGTNMATQIYRRLLSDTLAAATRSSADYRELWLDEAPAIDEVTQLAATHQLSLHAQRGHDIGQRMHHALAGPPGTKQHTLLVGSDCADLDAAYLNQAFAALDRHDAVLGPAADGGYVLIGLVRASQTLFDGIDWGTGQVLMQTRARLAQQQMAWHELPVRHDVDRVDDVMRIPHLAAMTRQAGLVCP